jgi:hypothetical protein
MRHWPITTILTFLIALILAVPAPAQQKPLTRGQVRGMVRDGLADETGAKAIEQRGIDFAPTEDFIQSLKTAGASEVFLAARAGLSTPSPQTPRGPSTKSKFSPSSRAKCPATALPCWFKNAASTSSLTMNSFGKRAWPAGRTSALAPKTATR